MTKRPSGRARSARSSGPAPSAAEIRAPWISWQRRTNRPGATPALRRPLHQSRSNSFFISGVARGLWQAPRGGVADLLNASRLEVIPPRLETETLDLRPVVEDAVERVRSRAELLRAEVTVKLPPHPVPVDADEAQLGRILDDLINNALTYTIRTPHVQIALSTDSRRAIVRVEDTGVGIPEREREQVFDRLYRVADPQVVVPGIGLGLYISRQLAERSGGSLVVESSRPDEGTVFALALPLSRTTSANQWLEAEGR